MIENQGFSESPTVTPKKLMPVSAPEEVPQSIRPFVKQAGHVLILELCAGSAKLSFTLQRWGMRSVPIDHGRNRHQPWWPTTSLDLSDPIQCSVLMDAIVSDQVDVIFAAPPCGTCSKARELRLSKTNHGPPPLRSKEYPRGFPNLRGTNLLKVQKANEVYDNLGILLWAGVQHGCLIAVENPKNSLLWDIDVFQGLAEPEFFDVTFQHCRWSPGEPSRAKWTTIRTNILELKSLSGCCELDHEHLKWGMLPSGQFATASEAEYPLGMCEAVAEALAEAFKTRGRGEFRVKDLLNADDVHPSKKRRMLAGKQPRGKKIPELISEFSQVLTLPYNSTLDSNCKLLRHEFERGEPDDEGFICDRAFPVVGIFRSPEEFVDDASKLRHPCDRMSLFPNTVCEAVQHNLCVPPEDIIRQRLYFLRSLVKHIDDSKEADQVIQSNWDQSSKLIMGSKKITSFGFLLNKLATQDLFHDNTLVEEMISGFSLVGLEPFKNCFDYDPLLPASSIAALQQNSEFNNRTIMSRTRSSGDESLDQALWDQVQEEVRSGWLVGPCQLVEELKRYTTGLYPHLSRRFALDQGTKVRPIDDLAESGINLCHGRFDRLWLMDVDYISSLIRLIEAATSKEIQSFTSSEGVEFDLSGIGSNLSKCSTWEGRTIDLKSAYKQLIVRPDQRWTSCLSIYNPATKAPELFCQCTLPFGAAASVLHFNRISRALWLIGTAELKLVWGNFYDDFPTLSPSIASKATDHSATLLLKLLGWWISEDPAKVIPFCEHFAALGVVFHINEIALKQSTVGNVDKRVQAVSKAIDGILDRGSISLKELESLRGKLQYMDSQVFGRLGKSMMSALYDSGLHSRKFTDDDSSTLLAIKHWLLNAEPRCISPDNNYGSIIIFTDGSSEYATGETILGLGAVLFDQVDGLSEACSYKVPQCTIDSWAEHFKKQYVTEAEVLAVLMAILTWQHKMSGRRVIFFIDSEPVKHSLIRGTSKAPICARIIRIIHSKLYELKCFSWFTRVPTKSNPADAPSRFSIQETVSCFNSTVVTPVLCEI